MIAACPRCNTQLPSGTLSACPRCLLEAEIEPAVMGGLELQEEIGRGGMGSVYRARHVRLGRAVAVKFLPEELASDPKFQTRFEREARMMAMLNHPNIVAVHDFGQDEGRSYLVMEFVEGEPLSRRIPMAPTEAIDIARQVCDALAYAHRHEIVHRDIKPDNILITADGHVKVTDFGIARLVRPDTVAGRLTGTNVAIGTPNYMSPEAMDAAAPDPRMDIFSLGVVLYELVTGRRPVGNFKPLPGALDAVVRKALAPDPAHRYASAEAMRDALRAAAEVSTKPTLPPDENTWIIAVAMLQSISTAVAIWAFLKCITPKEVTDDGQELMFSIITETVNGKTISRARFELWPTLAALATFALAITPYGFLRRHWRLGGLEEHHPDRPVPETRLVLIGGVASCVVYGVRLILQASGAKWVTAYIEPMGAMILVAVLFFFWISVLNAWRIHRPLAREPRLWFGFGLALIPPAIELVNRLRTFQT